MSNEKNTNATDTRKTFEVRPSQAPVDYGKLIDAAMKRFPKVHAILSE